MNRGLLPLSNKDLNWHLFADTAKIMNKNRNSALFSMHKDKHRQTDYLLCWDVKQLWVLAKLLSVLLSRSNSNSAGKGKQYNRTES